MQIKTTMRYHFRPIRMTVINKSTNKKCWQGCGERGTLLHYCWECRLMQPLWTAVWRYLKELKMDLLFDPAILHLGIYPKEPKTLNSKEYKHPYVHCSIIYSHQYMEAAQVSMSRQVDKTTMGHLHSEILLGQKKKKMLPFVTAWMDLENIMLSEISQAEKDKYHTISLMWSLSNEQIELTSKRETDS